MSIIYDATKPSTAVWANLGFEIFDLRAECKAKQAQIDSLMLEYCPDDMTEEQIENWRKYQVSGRDEHSAWWVRKEV